ncbi:MAG: PAC2 family protein [Anaerolineae bacterium]|nr:PAC2 family protein [Anaerolineae bacterium]MCB0204745.1 PAC2 family protein [Anaerolineae bacterium]MCB0255412.1 PAC2 family protein [Anaerolineae bacterium]
MNEHLELWDRPAADDVVMIAGWNQWADAGNISSGLPAYLIQHLNAPPIGQMNVDPCYFFQVPGTHHFLRPGIKLNEGMPVTLEGSTNAYHYWSDGRRGLVLFLGDEPHINPRLYADVFLDAAQEMGVRRIIALGGVYGAMPYDRDREIHAVYSLPEIKTELAELSVKFSNYEGGATIGTYLVYQAGQRGMEFIDFYAFVPAYDFAPLSPNVQGVRIDNDFTAWHEVMRRINHMLGTSIDISELESRSTQLKASMSDRIEEFDRKNPDLHVKEQMRRLSEGFAEDEFAPLDDLWEEELGDLLDGLGN